MRKILLVLSLLTVFTPASQAKYVTRLSDPGVDITRVFVHKSGAVSLYIEGDTLNADECTSTFRVYIPTDTPGKDSIVAVALTAFSMGKKVGFHGSGCGITEFWGGTQDVPIIDNMWMIQ